MTAMQTRSLMSTLRALTPGLDQMPALACSMALAVCIAGLF